MIFKQDKDVIVNLLRTIEEQNKTIDKLTDKLMAQRDIGNYLAYKDEPGQKSPIKEEEFIDPDLISGKEALNADASRAD